MAISKITVCLLYVTLICTDMFGAPRESDLTRETLENLVAMAEPKDKVLSEYMRSFSLEKYDVVVSPALGRYLVEYDSEDMIKTVVRQGWHREGHVFFPLQQYVRPGSTVVDLGAHIGTHTNCFAQLVGPSGKVHAFEPQLKIFIELVGNMYLNHRYNVVVHRAAVGNQTGWIEMNPPCPGNEGSVPVGSGGGAAPLVKLDELNLVNVSVIKIDVQGMEMEALEGASDTIRRNRPVLAVELEGDRNDRDNRIKTITSWGYSVTYLGHDDFLFVPK